jgi:hypothetical protein
MFNPASMLAKGLAQIAQSSADAGFQRVYDESHAGWLKRANNLGIFVSSFA